MCLLSSPSFPCSRTEDCTQDADSFFFPENSPQDYGITPEYICKRNEDMKKAQEEYDNYIQENLKKAAMKRLSDEEREAVLQVSPLRLVALWLSRTHQLPLKQSFDHSQQCPSES